MFDLRLLKRRFLRTKCSQVFVYGSAALIVILTIVKFVFPLFFFYKKIDNMDLPLTGDFPCKGSILPDKCAFNLPEFTRVPSKAKYICTTMFLKCQGFVYNTGTNVVIMKSAVSGFPKYSPGMELYVKSSYQELLNLTVEECAASVEEAPRKMSDMACSIPNLDPFDSSLIGLIKDTKLECDGSPITKYEGNQLTFITEGNNVQEVKYETITRKDQDFGHGVGQTGTLTRSNNVITLNGDAVRVIYYQNGKKQTDFHMSIVPIPEVMSRKGKDPHITMNIMMVGFDSTSRSHFSRKLPQIERFLKEQLNSYIYKGYSIVGDGTTAALLGALAGKAEEDLPEARKSKNGDYIDEWPFIFKTLHEYGYATFYSEDQAKYGTFHYRLKGFLNKPVDHWLRNFWVAASEHTGGNEYYCLGTEPSYTKRFRLIRSFFKAYPEKRKFGFSFFTIGHDDTNSLGFLQNDFLKFLKDFQKSGFLDNTLLIVFGDHGIRYGAIRRTILGKLEERLPFLSISVPKWFKEKHPDYAKNLQTNTERLTAPFDIYATFHHILSKSHQTHQYGQSLFEEISKSRTCKEAGNPEHFCPCIKWKTVNPNHKHIEQIAREAVHTINEFIKKENLEDKCSLLTLKKIQNAVYLAPNDQVETFEKSADMDGRIVAKGTKPKGMCHYQVQVLTAPNNGIYEVTGHVSSRTAHVNPEMSRLDQYGDQPKCIMGTHPKMRKYCHCYNHSNG